VITELQRSTETCPRVIIEVQHSAETCPRMITETIFSKNPSEAREIMKTYPSCQFAFIYRLKVLISESVKLCG